MNNKKVIVHVIVHDFKGHIREYHLSHPDLDYSIAFSENFLNGDNFFRLFSKRLKRTVVCQLGLTKIVLNYDNGILTVSNPTNHPPVKTIEMDCLDIYKSLVHFAGGSVRETVPEELLHLLEDKVHFSEETQQAALIAEKDSIIELLTDFAAFGDKTAEILTKYFTLLKFPQ